MTENIDYDKFSPEALQEMIAKAESVLRDKQQSVRKETIAKIKELANSIGVTFEIHELNQAPTKKGKKVEAKYRHPDDHTKTWTGRGVQPIWMRSLVEAGHDKEEFLI